MSRVPRAIVPLGVLLLASAPVSIPPPPGGPPRSIPDADDRFVESLERAHGGSEAFRAAGALRCGIHVTFADETILDGVLTYHDETDRVRVETKDGAVLLFDGRNAWCTANTDIPFGARYQLRTWPFFMTMPFQLRDRGVHVARGDLKAMEQRFCPTGRVTFDAGAVDAPDDWYLLYQSPHDQTLAAMAYVVTYGRSKSDGEPTPYSVVFRKHQRVNGILLPTRWTFHEWTELRGPHGEATGAVTITNPQFVEPNDADFVPATGMVVDPKK